MVAMALNAATVRRMGKSAELATCVEPPATRRTAGTAAVREAPVAPASGMRAAEVVARNARTARRRDRPATSTRAHALRRIFAPSPIPRAQRASPRQFRFPIRRVRRKTSKTRPPRVHRGPIRHLATRSSRSSPKPRPPAERASRPSKFRSTTAVVCSRALRPSSMPRAYTTRPVRPIASKRVAINVAVSVQPIRANNGFGTTSAARSLRKAVHAWGLHCRVALECSVTRSVILPKGVTVVGSKASARITVGSERARETHHESTERKGSRCRSATWRGPRQSTSRRASEGSRFHQRDLGSA